jgi:hypothetical protein
MTFEQAAKKACIFDYLSRTERNRKAAKRAIYRATVNCELLKAKAMVRALQITRLRQ